MGWINDLNSHGHNNKMTLDKIGELNGQITFNGSIISSGGSSATIENQWQGKIWNAIGDSITDVNADGNTRYQIYVAQMLGCTVNSYGYSGYSLARGSNTNIPDAMDYVVTQSPTADLVTVFAGTNDWGYKNLPLGTFTDSTDTTVYGALHVICQKLINQYPTAKYALFTPTRRADDGNLGRGVNGQGYKLSDVADAILEVGGYYSIPVLDLQRCGGIEPAITVHKTNFMPDALHPNSAGAERIARVISEFLRGV